MVDQEKASVEAMKDAYLRSTEAPSREPGPEIDLLSAKTTEAKADAKIEYAKSLTRLRTKQDVVATRLGEARKASEDAREELKA